MKVLHYIYGLNHGGAETFIYNVLNNIDTKIFKFDFLCQDEKMSNKNLIELAKKRKCKIVQLPSFYKNPIKHIVYLRKFLKRNEYDIIHYHANSLTNISLFLLKKCYSSKLILHSHNSSNNRGGTIGKVVHLTNRTFFSRKADKLIACSKIAALWMFKDENFTLIQNGIDFNKYKFNLSYRNSIRKKYNVGESFLIGDVSRFVDAKNHIFLLDIFREFLKHNSTSKLMLVGEGPNKQNIINYIKKHQIENNVIVVPSNDNVHKYYSAFDVFVRPSLFEGLPFCLIEAQASLLPIFSSFAVSNQVNISGNIQFVDIDKGAKYWANLLYDFYSKHDYDRTNQQSFLKVSTSSYNIGKTLEDLVSIYNNLFIS